MKARIGAVVAAAAAAVLAITGTAIAHDGSGRSEGHGTFALGSFDWRFQRDSDGHVSGYFKAVATQPAGILVAPQGRVTCASFEGNKVGFLYLLEGNTRPAVAKGTYILITAEDNGGHGRDKVGFLGPAPKAAFPGCDPSLTPFNVISGHTRVDSGSDD
jgi:hypothetical protein